MTRFLALSAALLLLSGRAARADDDEGWRDRRSTEHEDGDRGWRDGRRFRDDDRRDRYARRDDDDEDEDDRRDWRDRGDRFDDDRFDGDFRRDPALASGGEWIDTPEYGVVWRPTQVATDWRPYSAGRWAYTAAGWGWVSDEPFGWAVYHYGRWAFVSGAGWLWLPGRVWAPAWVAWRWGDGYAGWCPLGPTNVFYDEPRVWVFVEQRNFLNPVQHSVVPFYDQQRLAALPVLGPRASPVPHVVERATGRGIRPMPIADASTPRGAGQTGGQVAFYRPRIAAAAAQEGGGQGAPVSPRGPRGQLEGGQRGEPRARPGGESADPRPRGDVQRAGPWQRGADRAQPQDSRPDGRGWQRDTRGGARGDIAPRLEPSGEFRPARGSDARQPAPGASFRSAPSQGNGDPAPRPPPHPHAADGRK